MSGEPLHLTWGDGNQTDCICLLIIPEKAIDEPGYIKGLHCSGATNKHELHALAQTAYFQYQDDELEFVSISQPIVISSPSENEQLEAGLVLLRDRDGTIKAVVHEFVSMKKLLESANRFCTRWVRLDI
jgi:hypothetical protein